MERKLATVLFVDLVDSSALVSGSDPEVVRRRVTRFFDRASNCIQAHGGTVEKFAGDAVMAAFGIPRAHEDDAERALRAALSIREAVVDLGLEARIGVEAGEVVADDGDSTFATGEAVHRAARLQAEARPNEILVGPGAQRLAQAAIELEPDGVRELRGLPEPIPAWRALTVREEPRRPSSTAPLVGRASELELLENTYRRAVRDGRAHLFTIFGDPGVGKSRLAREFVSSLDGATVLAGRCLPYGEGITYWPLAEMVKAAAGISDDDPTDEAHEKLLVCCEDEAVADLLGLASGVLEAVEGERSQQEIAWAAREWATMLARTQPLVLVFEDIHWAEEPLLELIAHLAEAVRESPLLILCLARPELLDVRPDWGGGRVRATAIELEPLAREESEILVDALLADVELPERAREAVLDKTEGNPLFVEETVRMLADYGDGYPVDRVPDTLHALIAARIDRLPTHEKAHLQRASVIGRVFWRGALEHLAGGEDRVDSTLDDLLLRDFVVHEQRSTITGDRAYRFKHVLIREVAYAGLPKSDRAAYHQAFAEWLREHAGEELLEIRAYHLGQAARLLGELDGAPPPELAHEAADALHTAGKRAFARESYAAARKLFLEAVELAPTLERRYLAAKAAWRTGDLPAVVVEAEELLRAAEESGDRRIQGRALTTLAHVVLYRDADVERARELGNRALALIDEGDHIPRYEALDVLGTIAWWQGDLGSVERYGEEKLAIARETARKDLESAELAELAGAYDARIEGERAEPLIARALELAEDSGSILARGWVMRSKAELHAHRGETDEAEAAFEEARRLFAEASSAVNMAGVTNWLAHLLRERGELDRAERLLREVVRTLKPLGDRGTLVETQRQLAEVLLAQGRIEEAERLALESRRTVGPEDASSRATTRKALGLVRAAQGRDEEAEALLREAVEILQGTDFRRFELEPLEALAQFLRERSRDAEAAAVEARIAELTPARSTAPIA